MLSTRERYERTYRSARCFGFPLNATDPIYRAAYRSYYAKNAQRFNGWRNDWRRRCFTLRKERLGGPRLYFFASSIGGEVMTLDEARDYFGVTRIYEQAERGSWFLRIWSWEMQPCDGNPERDGTPVEIMWQPVPEAVIKPQEAAVNWANCVERDGRVYISMDMYAQMVNEGKIR